jgi:hypothetical protein
MTKLLSIADALAEYRLSRSGLYRLLRSGRLTARKRGSRTFLDRDVMEAYVASLPPYRPLARREAHDHDAD